MTKVIFALRLVHPAPPDAWEFTRFSETLRPFKVDMSAAALGSSDRLTATKRFPSVFSSAHPYVIPAVALDAFKFEKSVEEIEVKDGKGKVTNTKSSAIRPIIESILSGDNNSQYVQAPLEQFEPGTLFFGVRDSLGRGIPAAATAVSNIPATTIVLVGGVRMGTAVCLCVNASVCV